MWKMSSSQNFVRHDREKNAEVKQNWLGDFPLKATWKQINFKSVMLKYTQCAKQTHNCSSSLPTIEKGCRTTAATAKCCHLPCYHMTILCILIGPMALRPPRLHGQNHNKIVVFSHHGEPTEVQRKNSPAQPEAGRRNGSIWGYYERSKQRHENSEL